MEPGCDYSHKEIDEAAVDFDSQSNWPNSGMSLSGWMESRNRQVRPCKFLRGTFQPALQPDHAGSKHHNAKKLRLLPKSSTLVARLSHSKYDSSIGDLKPAVNEHGESIQEKLSKYNQYSVYRSHKSLIKHKNLISSMASNLMGAFYKTAEENASSAPGTFEARRTKKNLSRKSAGGQFTKLSLPKSMDPDVGQSITNPDFHLKSSMVSTPTNNSMSIKRGFFLKSLVNRTYETDLNNSEAEVLNDILRQSTPRALTKSRFMNDSRQSSAPKFVRGGLPMTSVRDSDGETIITSKPQQPKDSHISLPKPHVELTDSAYRVKTDTFLQELIKGVYTRSLEDVLQQVVLIQAYEQTFRDQIRSRIGASTLLQNILNQKCKLMVDPLNLVSILYTDDSNAEEIRIATLIVQKGANLDKKDHLGNTPFQNAILNVASRHAVERQTRLASV